MIPWTNKYEDISEINVDRNGVIEEDREDDLYEDWAKYDEELRERWTKFVGKQGFTIRKYLYLSINELWHND